MTQTISRGDLEALIASNHSKTIVEALPREYYDAEHLPGAINIPHDEIVTRAARLIPDKSAPVVVYCASTECKNSHQAAEILRGLGYRKVYEYSEGKKGWKEAGLPLEVG